MGQTLDMPDIGYELGSGLMWVSEPDVEPRWDDDQNEW